MKRQERVPSPLVGKGQGEGVISSQEIQLGRRRFESIPRQRWDWHTVLFENLLEQASRAWGLRFDGTVDKQIDPHSLA
jgi:hypothetical protein